MLSRKGKNARFASGLGSPHALDVRLGEVAPRGESSRGGGIFAHPDSSDVVTWAELDRHSLGSAEVRVSPSFPCARLSVGDTRFPGKSGMKNSDGLSA